ncbi:hypothetical protein PPL_07587 [Heterostelium album PN500]|uniref:Uncharacterized protein n=1 Tax=Heterostelium pallidum (strain ATCC 26659 / Pp 5 / PN500) TaxID=670386 RepID=D3BGD6_HETP5|nr:hypothetical protein PPL_07587 [Heterostelium album PN500]EFA79536.1 hypothetical protein PPL_07587 [Heterostelium album PN500]|eukprot:XP_020431657.1 hypothetical protein PPL_07587 [Heterostelium album PN500]
MKNDKLTVKSDYVYILFKNVYRTKKKEYKDGRDAKRNVLLVYFGEMGPITSGLKVIKFQAADQTAIIRCYSECYSAIWGALTLMCKVEDNPCMLEVIKMSAFLTSLASPNRFSTTATTTTTTQSIKQSLSYQFCNDQLIRLVMIHFCEYKYFECDWYVNHARSGYRLINEPYFKRVCLLIF